MADIAALSSGSLAGRSFQLWVRRTDTAIRWLTWNVVYTTPLSPMRADSGIIAIPVAFQRREQAGDIGRKIDALCIGKYLRRPCPYPGRLAPGPLRPPPL